MIRYLIFFIIEVLWRGIQGIKIDDTGTLNKIPYHQFNVFFVWSSNDHLISFFNEYIILFYIFLYYTISICFVFKSFFLSSGLLAINFTLKVDKWDDRGSNPGPLHILFSIMDPNMYNNNIQSYMNVTKPIFYP
jgi:hypothetical protein